MEAAWTYFFHISLNIWKIIGSGVLGELRHVHSSFSHNVGVDTLPGTDQFINVPAGEGPPDIPTIGLDQVSPLENLANPLSHHLETGDLPIPQIQSRVTHLQLADPSRPGNGTVDETVIASRVFPALTPTTSPATATFHTSIVTTAMTGTPACYVPVSRGQTTLDGSAPQPPKLTLETDEVERVPTRMRVVKSDVKTDFIS